MQSLDFYYAPPSFYSQVAHLALVEAQYNFETIIVAPGPPHFSTYSPHYMSLNNGGTVPTLVVDDLVLDDSRKILDWISQQTQSSYLAPSDQENLKLLTRWVDLAYSLPERELAYGTGLIKYIGRIVNGKRLKTLKKLKKQHPNMADMYQAKIDDIHKFMLQAASPEHVQNLADRYDEAMDKLNENLSHNDMILGNEYSLADCCWTVSIARQSMLKREPLKNRPHLAAWFQKMQNRPSYKTAIIMDHFSFKPMIQMIRGDFKYHKSH